MCRTVHYAIFFRIYIIGFLITYYRWESVVSSVLWRCWLGDRKGIRPVISWMLVCWWWRFDWSVPRLIAPVITTTSIVISSNKVQNGDILASACRDCSGKWPLSEGRRRRRWESVEELICSDFGHCTHNSYLSRQNLRPLRSSWCFLCRVFLRIWIKNCRIRPTRFVEIEPRGMQHNRMYV